ncbi:serpin, putative [Schistosoma mansoni]|uniref:Serpin, putative n=1 Tax=Schistosoma mansoni TaxID=6183 RepID=G4LZN6_SCHMA|nr:serpin, putative [Schistosoma mansoni]|eukprot:XP_018646704.1 serpin, putative [Schistosoma mansoni]
MDVLQSLKNFSGRFYGDIVEEKQSHSENTFLSPFNVYTALGMILSGSEMNTKAEIMKVMHLSNCLEHHAIHYGISGLLFDCSERGEGVEIMFGNGLFTAEDVNVKEDYQNTLKSYYNAQTESVAFQMDPEDAGKRINQWASSLTKGKIQELFSSQSLSTDTSVLVITTTYFEGMWDLPFLQGSSHESDFFKLDGSTMNVKLMYMNSSFDMTSLPDLKSRAIKIPFKNPKFSLLIVLPNANDGLLELLDALHRDDGISSILSSNFKDTSLHLYLPKFKLKEGNAISLVDCLQKMGMKEAFHPGSANFTNMSESSNFCIRDILHKAILEVNEQGVVAAAASSVEVVQLSAPLPEFSDEEFRVNHSFFVSIIWKDSVPIFLGHVTNPIDQY